jgi:hypothetical protein
MKIDSNSEITVNQALDLIMTTGKTSRLQDLVKKLKALKEQAGGNAKIDNSKEILFIIQES